MRLFASVRSVSHARLPFFREVQRVQGTYDADITCNASDVPLRLKEPDCPFKHSSDDIKVPTPRALARFSKHL
jgi:hypothetical protein